ncbi:MAG: response regulator [Verrucomicrobiae bacterium]|nr:response regulator [Verrucomicrobiae bacterium]
MKRVLLADDDAQLVSLCQRKFEADGFAVEVRTEAGRALEALKVTPYDLVVLELAMPQGGGLTVLIGLRTQGARKDAPVLIYTRSEEDYLRQAAQAAGISRILSKHSCSPAELLAQARELLGLPPSAEGAAAGGERGREEFVRHARLALTVLRNRLQTITRQAGDPGVLAAELAAATESAHALVSGAAAAGFQALAQLTGLLEGLLRELRDAPRKVNPSNLRSLAVALDVLGGMLKPEGGWWLNFQQTPLALIVDDDTISRRTMRAALQKAGIRSVCIPDAESALRLLEDNEFDLILSDVMMPGMDGFAFCEKLRQLPKGKQVPVVFITSLSGFEARMRLALSGGTDLVGKPFSMPELGLRALCCIVKAQTAAPAASRPAVAPPAPAPA